MRNYWRGLQGIAPHYTPSEEALSKYDPDIDDYQFLLNAGAKHKDIRAYLGPIYAAAGFTDAQIHEYFREQAMPGLIRSLESGWQSSWSGMTWRDKLPDDLQPEEVEAMNWWQRMTSGVATFAGDIPPIAAGGAVGAGAAIMSGNPLLAVYTVPSGAFGTLEGMKAAKRAELEKKSLPEQLVDTASGTFRGMVTGLGTAGSGLLAQGAAVNLGLNAAGQTAAKLAAEGVAMPMVSAGLEGRSPSTQEVVDNSILIAGMYVGGKALGVSGRNVVMAARDIAPKLGRIGVDLGKTPEEVVNAAQNDPTVRQDLLSINKDVPDALHPPEADIFEGGESGQDFQGSGFHPTRTGPIFHVSRPLSTKSGHIVEYEVSQDKDGDGSFKLYRHILDADGGVVESKTLQEVFGGYSWVDGEFGAGFSSADEAKALANRDASRNADAFVPERKVASTGKESRQSPTEGVEANKQPEYNLDSELDRLREEFLESTSDHALAAERTELDWALDTASQVSLADIKERREAIVTALSHGRGDIIRAILERTRSYAENFDTTPGVSKDSPKYETIKANLEARKSELEREAIELENFARLNEIERDAAPTDGQQEPVGQESQPAPETSQPLVTPDQSDVVRRELAKPYIDQLVEAGHTPEEAQALVQPFMANAEVMAPMFGQTPREYLESRLAGFKATTPEEFAGMGEEGEQHFQAAMKALDDSMQAVREQHKGTDTWMKAPNGQPTKLNERQWLAVRTPEFKQWFGDWQAAAVMEGPPVKSVTTAGIPQAGAKLSDLALQWLEQNPISPIIAITKDGALRIEVTKNGLEDSFGHSKYKNKIAVLPAVKPILERGAYLGHMADLEGKPIENYYFAAPVEIDGERKIVFVRVREPEGREASLYVHEVFTEDEIEKSDELAALLSRRPLRGMQTSGATSKKTGNPSDLYRSIIREALAVNPVSKLVDPETGEPLVVYHGTNADFSTFEPRPRMISGEVSTAPDGLVFAAAEPPVAGAFARDRERSQKTGAASIMPLFLAAKNPIDLTDINLNREIADAAGIELPGGYTTESAFNLLEEPAVLAEIKRRGFDSAILNEPGHPFTSYRAAADNTASTETASDFSGMRSYPARTFAVFDSTQVKSAIGNTGAFDARNHDIRYQQSADAPRGAISFGDKGAIISLFQNKNLSTVLHEGGHFFLENLREAAGIDTAPDWVKESWKTVQSEYGFTGDTVPKEAHEQFARDFEAYLREGKAPSPKLESAFAKFKEWLTEIYKSVKDILGDRQLSPEVREVFDNLLRTETPEKAEPPRQASEPITYESIDKGDGTFDVTPELEQRLALVERRMGEGEAGQRFQKDDGTWDGVKSTNPEWLRADTVTTEVIDGKTKTVKRPGVLKEAGKAGISRVIEKVRAGKPLTAKQQEVWRATLDAADHEWNNDPATVQGRELEALANQGFELTGPQQVPAGNIIVYDG